MDTKEILQGLACCTECGKTHVCPAGCPYDGKLEMEDGILLSCDTLLTRDALRQLQKYETALWAVLSP